ncbi:hypothetical protein Pcinc_036883 [Petrolisthes cinctipes]|uniref:Uncharacterized protein n=1 Tax=Petrolisthes cinctipes TaxID=88211 RepID=A0AAE1ELW8_PETCI|nr:hypothetical protein Pcinc_036883 [Petrolisthes cinctipes]
MGKGGGGDGWIDGREGGWKEGGNRSGEEEMRGIGALRRWEEVKRKEVERWRRVGGNGVEKWRRVGGVEKYGGEELVDWRTAVVEWRNVMGKI